MLACRHAEASPAVRQFTTLAAALGTKRFTV
jgi:hypothetical protein